MKKTLLSLGAIATAGAPIAAVVSCGKTENGEISYKGFAVARQDVAGAMKISSGDLPNWKVALTLDGHDHSEKDKSFNEAAYEGIKENGLPISLATQDVVKPVSPSKVGDFVDMYNFQSKKTLMVAPGYMHIGPLTSDEGKAATIDKGVILLDGDVAAKNIASVIFRADQAAFLAGVQAGYYIHEHAADYKAGGYKVGTFGGLNMPTVTSFMGGFQQGIEYYNAHKPTKFANETDIQFIDLGSKADYFSGGFASGQGKQLAEKLLREGADMIMPVAGPQTGDVVTAIKQAKSNAKVIGVDSAQEIVSEYQGTVVFSALKDLKNATIKEIKVIGGQTVSNFNGGFGKVAIGTIDNDLVGVSKGNASTDANSYATTAGVKAAAKAAKEIFNW